MAKRRCPLLIGAAALCFVGAASAEPQKVQTTVQKVTSHLRPEVGLYYSRSLAPEHLSDFRQYAGAQLALGVVVDPTILIRASMSIDRDIGAPIETFRASNTTLTAAKLWELGKVGWLRTTLLGRLPTNDDDRLYLTYRGSFGASVGLFNEQLFTFGKVHALGGGITLTGMRNVFEYTTSLEGYTTSWRSSLSNRLWSLGASASLVYTLFQRLSFIVGLQNSLFWTWQGRDNDRYQLSAAIQYRAPYDLRLSLMTVTADRTFQNDQVTMNVNLYKPESTLVVFAISYAPNFEQL